MGIRSDSALRGLEPRSLALRIGSSLLLVLIIFIGMDILVRQMLYPAPAFRVPSPPPTPFEEVWLETEAGTRVHGWYRSSSEAARAVLFFHGNGENLATLSMSGLFEDFGQSGASILAIDYPGYGLSSGTPSEAGLRSAGLAAHDWLTERSAGRSPIVVGWSLGAAVAMQTVAERPSSALLLASPWNDLPSVARRFFPAFFVKMALRDRYDSGQLAAGTSVDRTGPVRIVHGEGDQLIPITEGRRLHTAFGGHSDLRMVEIVGAGHNDLMGRPELWQVVRELLAETGPR